MPQFLKKGLREVLQNVRQVSFAPNRRELVFSVIAGQTSFLKDLMQCLNVNVKMHGHFFVFAGQVY